MNSSTPNEILIEEQAVEKKVSFYFTSLVIGSLLIYLGLWIVGAFLYYLGKLSVSIGGPSLELPLLIWYVIGFVLLLTLLLIISGLINHVKRRVRFDFANQKIEELDTDDRIVLSIPFKDLTFIKIEEHKIESFSQRFSKGSRAGFFVTLHLFDKHKKPNKERAIKIKKKIEKKISEAEKQLDFFSEESDRKFVWLFIVLEERNPFIEPEEVLSEIAAMIERKSDTTILLKIRDCSNVARI